MRRKYAKGKCRDCGWITRVTTVIFWVNGMHYDVCSQCIKPYRKVICTNGPSKEENHAANR